MTGRGRPAVAVAVLALLAFGGAGGCDCPQIRQQVFIATPDATLAPLVEACRMGVAPAGQSCPAPRLETQMSVSCPCLPLCRRVMELIDQFSGGETLISCDLHVRSGSGTGTGGAGGGAGAVTDTRPLTARPDTVAVTVTYRPSTCE